MIYHYKVKVLRVIDGDTLECEIDLGFKMVMTDDVRLYGINAPETRGQQAVPAGKDATNYVKAWLGETPTSAGYNFNLMLWSNEFKPREKYGRILGTIYRDGDLVSLNDALVNSGHAVPYV